MFFFHILSFFYSPFRGIVSVRACNIWSKRNDVLLSRYAFFTSTGFQVALSAFNVVHLTGLLCIYIFWMNTIWELLLRSENGFKLTLIPGISIITCARVPCPRGVVSVIPVL